VSANKSYGVKISVLPVVSDEMEGAKLIFLISASCFVMLLDCVLFIFKVHVFTEILENYARLYGENIRLNDGLILYYKECTCSEHETRGVNL
jgi:hypothetical protein